MTDEVKMHRVGYGSKHLPAVNVKVRHWGITPQDLDDRWGISLANAEDALEAYIEAARELFWHDIAPDQARDIFGEGVEVFQEGRSGGWLVVEGLPSPETWDEDDRERWSEFRDNIKANIDDLTSPEQIEHWLEVNGYHLDSREVTIRIEECGSCGQWHPASFSGDCRNDTWRFEDPEQAERMYDLAPKMFAYLKYVQTAIANWRDGQDLGNIGPVKHVVVPYRGKLNLEEVKYVLVDKILDEIRGP